MKFKKEEQVGARLHASTKAKLQKTGYNAAEAIEWFVHEFYNTHPKRKLQIQRDLLEIKLNNLKEVECEVQTEIGVVERQLEELGPAPSPADVNVEPVPEVPLPPNVRVAIDRIIAVYEEKKDMLVGKNTSPAEALDLFITQYGDLVLNVYSECGKGLDWSDFKDLLLSEVMA